MASASADQRDLRLTMAIEEVPGVDARRGASFRALGIPSLAHLLHHLPHRYEREEPEAPIGSLEADRVVTARGEVTSCRVSGPYHRRRFEAVLHDGSGRLELVWFNQPYLQNRIGVGDRLIVTGKSKRRGGELQVANPRWEPEGASAPEGDEPRLRPVYPASEALPSRIIERVVGGVLDEGVTLIEDHLPEAFREERGLLPLAGAYRMLHRPGEEGEVLRATERLIYDELLLLQLGVHMRRAMLRRTLRAPALRWSGAIDEHIRARLPFRLTPGQDAVVEEVARDLQEATPANRLIQGDVGSGKTAVALYALLMAVASQKQGALMAPTEVLAEQHHRSISAMLSGASVRVALLTGSLTAGERAEQETLLAEGEIDLVIGTHALLTERVRFGDLGVVVIDEQHRFGVHQRANLRKKAEGEGLIPHTLVMTATPIPRTLALTIFGDLDVSTVHGAPPGRSGVITKVVEGDRREEVYEFIRERVAAGEQAYVVVPAVEGDEDGEGALADVRGTVARLESGPLKERRVAGVHGRLKRETREAAMERFRAGAIDVLVSTTVIEVGVDVANATVMVVDHADRFGLAQLHQLRGRVGRGEKQGLCVLVVDDPTEEGRARVEAVAQTRDGFELAEMDLRLRGPGGIIGARQSGLAPFRLAEFPRDMELLLAARRDASAWIDRSPTLTSPGESLLRSRLMKAHGASLGIADVA
jgi:ATP-dependent DNA helicase RecG